MRGKLRDKHSTSKHDEFRFEDDVMRHSPKRSGRSTSWSYQWEEEELDFEEEAEAVEETENAQLDPQSEQEQTAVKAEEVKGKVTTNKK